MAPPSRVHPSAIKLTFANIRNQTSHDRSTKPFNQANSNQAVSVSPPANESNAAAIPKTRRGNGEAAWNAAEVAHPARLWSCCSSVGSVLQD